MGVLKELAKRPIEEVEGRPPIRVRPATTLLEVVKALKGGNRGAVIVVDDDGRISGVFTERDVMLRLDHSNLDWHTIPVGEVMTRNPKTIAADAPIAEALRLMTEGAFRHLPVVDDDGRAISVASIRAIMAHLVEHFPEEFVNLPPDPDHEASRPYGG